MPMSGSFYLKVKFSWLLVARDRQKAASLRSNTVYQVLEGGKELNRLYGFVTV